MSEKNISILSGRDAPSDEYSMAAAQKLWIWRNGDHFWVFDHEFPTYADGDPQTLGKPHGWGIFKPNNIPFPVKQDAAVAPSPSSMREGVEAAKRIVAAVETMKGKRLAIAFRDDETALHVGFLIENAGKVARALLQSEREVIERCAKVADDYERTVTAFSHDVQTAAEKAARTIASRIRALKD